MEREREKQERLNPKINDSNNEFKVDSEDRTLHTRLINSVRHRTFFFKIDYNY
jgi:hypothetical protein